MEQNSELQRLSWQQNQLLTRNQLAEAFGVSASTIDNWRDWYNLPEVKLGGRTVRFIYEDVVEQLKKQRG